MKKVEIYYVCKPLEHEVGFEQELIDLFNNRGFDLLVARYNSKTYVRHLIFKKDITKEEPEIYTAPNRPPKK